MTQANNQENSDNEIEGAEGASEEAIESSADIVQAAQDSDLSKARHEVDSLKKELAQSQDKYLRSLADLENFKKRSLKDRAELLKYQGEQLVLDLIAVIDDFDLAMQFNEGQYKNADPEKFKQGMELIFKNFCEVLKKWQIRAESSIGKPFDPSKHLAISKIVSDEASPGIIVSELKKVFFYKDKILRVGEVVVAAEQEN